MKRMYVVLSVILLVFVWALTSLGQKITQEDEPAGFDRMKRRMELREEMHKRMRERILHGIGPDQDLFQGMDQMFEDAMSDSFTDIDSLVTTSSNFSTEWVESKEGRTLIVTPKNKDQQLNIDVNNDLITIKGQSEQKSENTSVSSSFSNSFSVPPDCDASKVKMNQKDGKILIEFPFKTAKSVTVPPKEEERKPLPHVEGEVTI